MKRCVTVSNYCIKTTYGNFIVHFIAQHVPSSQTSSTQITLWSIQTWFISIRRFFTLLKISDGDNSILLLLFNFKHLDY